ncbi:sensor histidine kinase [Micromonospora coxensis]|uniref:Signal transduction histidine kinase n=1 Tax=Micromonospora coxensis TaxID=356852 RepID=A0A1C5I019_9ACTN|nr:ATP-binding protein [Micromonospora coxensis]SCG51600.1 Signal transduction histidine kinase [Micromonospora coxensis]
MSAVPAPTSPPSLPDRPAEGAFHLIFTTLPALLRLTCGLAGAVAALVVRTPPVRTGLLVTVVALLTAWSVLYAVRAFRVGIGAGLVAGDLALTVAACLLMPVLVAPEVLPGEGSWIAVLASTTVINTQATAPARWSVPAGLLVTAGYATGSWAAGDPTEAGAHAATLLGQTGLAALMTWVMRRWIGRADHAFADYQRLRREALVARAAREAERRQNRDLHDTVLSTLTMVGLGAVPDDSPALRRRAAADLRTLVGLVGDDGTSPTGPVSLDAWLRAVVEARTELSPQVELAPCVAPAEVARALADATAAALANVVRHAPDAAVTVRLSRTGETVLVEVVDDGPGFDPATVPTHRYGLRESIRARTAEVGGRAEVTSAPGRGTRIRMEWPYVR